MAQRVPQLIKYIGNKTKFSEKIASTFPSDYDCYFEPFLGSGALLGALKPHRSVAVDAHRPLIEMWDLAKNDPHKLLESYTENWNEYSKSDEAKKTVYKRVVDSYNSGPNPLDFLFISRTCYGGVLRYRKADGALSTPVGAHKAIPPAAFEKRLRIWHALIQQTTFICGDFSEISNMVTSDSIVYCDPPYIDTQKILYGAQAFSVDRLVLEIERWKEVGSFVALSIDGTKKSGSVTVDFENRDELFEEVVAIELGGSMLKRFQLRDQSTTDHRVTDRLLLTRKSGEREVEQQLLAV